MMSRSAQKDSLVHGARDHHDHPRPEGAAAAAAVKRNQHRAGKREGIIKNPDVCAHEFKLRFDDANKKIYFFPQDIIDNTNRAFNLSATDPTGYPNGNKPTGRYIAPANGPTCAQVVTGDCAINDEIMADVRALGAQLVFKPVYRKTLVDLARTLLTSPTGRT